MAVFKYSRILSLNHYKFIVNFCGEQMMQKQKSCLLGQIMITVISTNNGNRKYREGQENYADYLQIMSCTGQCS